jgi:DNA helicase-2/ATP-dependent DNA helicase PcrA
MKQLNIDDKQLQPRAVINTISRAKDKLQTPEDFMAESGKDLRMSQIATIYELYQKHLFDANALDFDDIIMLTNRLFETHRDVLDIYREQFKYILVDEYQDTNPSQSKLVAFLSGKHKNVCVVGDDDQSIYSFRGATVENILGFDKTYNNVKTVRLEQNYRSAGNILTAANGIISHNVDRKGKELWTEADDGEKVHLTKVESQSAEAEFICDTIQKKVADGKSYSDFAVLYRVNALSQSLETAFVKKRIPYKIFGGLRFYERREIKDILAYLSVVANPSDTVRLRRIINVPKRAIGDTTVERASNLADENGISLFSVIDNAQKYPELQRASQKLKVFTDLIKKLREFAHTHTLSATVSEVIEATGYRLMLAEEDDGTEREENVLELVSSAKLFEETAENPTLAEFLNEISLVSDLDNYDSGSESVSLMTVHSAKGLEFDTVFIPGFEEGLFPSAQSFNEGDRAIEEERRLAYVAVTRAKKELFLINTDSRMLYGRTEMKKISRFANEIPEKARDFKNTGTKSNYSHQSPQQTANSAEVRSRYLENIRANAQNVEKPKFFEAGSTVIHPMFGEGEILSAAPMGGDVLYEIEFKNGSVKRIMGSFARLKSK